MSSQPESLQNVFVESESKRNELDQYPSSSSSNYQEALSLAIQGYTKCLEIVDRISLFSTNESLEDISSSELEYFLLNYYLGDLFQKQTTDLSQRKSILITARDFFEKFLKSVDSYEILDKKNERLLERYFDNRDDFAVVQTTDPASRRGEKIARLKAERELKTKLQLLRQDPLLLQHDDDALRKLRLAQIFLCVHETFQSLELIAMELNILAQASKIPSHREQPQDERNRDKSQDNYSDRLDTSYVQSLTSKTGPILDRDGKLLRPFTLLDNRTRLQQGVFRPDHNLPTMSIDEYLEEERKRGGIIEGGGEKSGIRPQIDEDDFDKADEETMKARQWDDFKDDNPKGSGNTLNRG